MSLPANAWVKVTDGGDTGQRAQPALAYDSDAGVYLLVGGSQPYRRIAPYDVQALSLAEGVWRNQYPLDRLTQWGPEVGDSTAPGFTSERFEVQDSTGYPRPNFQVYGGIQSYSQYAWDDGARRLTFYLHNRTFSYSTETRAWTFHAPALDPAGGTTKPRLLWGSLAVDPTTGKALLFGGGNVQVASGEPGTWIYEPATTTWRQLTGQQPPPRAYSPLVVDPDRRKALLFGGDELDRLKSDTWAFDFATETWSQLSPTRAPAPRAGHQLLFLPQSRATVLLGGWEYTSTTDYVQPQYRAKPWELWRFDWGSSEWQLLKRFSSTEPQPSLGATSNLSLAAAAGAGDVVVMNATPSQTWAMRVDPTMIDAPGTQQYGVDAGTFGYATGRFDPDWYVQQGPAPDAGERAAFASLVQTVPDNTWVDVTTPNRPRSNHDWGTAAIDPSRSLLFRWSGGHSAWSGTDVVHYDYSANRFSIGYRPELPLEFFYSNDQIPGQWSFKRRPWMTGHTYKMYAFSPALDRMVIHKEPFIYFYDPARRDFAEAPHESSIGGNFYTDVLWPLPNGMAAWTPNGLHRITAVSQSWTKLMPTAMGGATLPQITPDRNSMIYEATGNRLLLFSGNDKGQVYEYAFGANTLRRLDPMGLADFAANGSTFMREAVYLPGQQLVLFAIGYGTQGRVPVYDVAENRWYAYLLSPQPFTRYGNSFAIVYDPSADRIWAMDQHNEVRVLKLVKATADRLPLN